MAFFQRNIKCVKALLLAHSGTIPSAFNTKSTDQCIMVASANVIEKQIEMHCALLWPSLCFS
jgi:hypothetical protein